MKLCMPCNVIQRHDNVACMSLLILKYFEEYDGLRTAPSAEVFRAIVRVLHKYRAFSVTLCRVSLCTLETSLCRRSLTLSRHAHRLRYVGNFTPWCPPPPCLHRGRVCLYHALPVYLVNLSAPTWHNPPSSVL